MTSSRSPQVSPAAVESRIQEFLESRTKRTWEPSVDLFDSGVVSSLFAMELVVFVESAFDVMVEGNDLSLDNFRTVNSMSALIRRLRAASDHA